MKVPLLGLLAFAIGALAACGDNIVDPALPEAAERFDPPAVYLRWWGMTQECAGVQRNFRDVKWYRTPAARIELNGEYVNAYWSMGSNRVVITDGARNDGSVVRHEMLHALIRQEGHPRTQFVEKCAGVVHCEEGCIEAPATMPDPPPSVEASELDVQVSLVPSTPSQAVDGGFFSVVITATNPSDRAISVTVRPRPPGGTLVTFSATLVGNPSVPTRVTRVIDPTAVTFQARETKRQVFDYRIDPTGTFGVRPGAYFVQAAYASQSAPMPQVTLGAN